MHGTTMSVICGGLVAVSMLTLTTPCDARVTRDEMAARIGTKRIAAGAEGNHTCFVRADGNVLCWGDNANGQIGDGTSGNVRRAPTATGITTAVDVAVGRDHSCALLASGAVQCWGSNASGQLGVGSGTASSPVPMTVPGLSGVVSLTAGTAFNCARKSDGTVRCWGTNQFGQLGDDTTTSPRFAPVAVANLTDAVKVVAGATHTCALRAGGVMACWGSNSQGQLGTGNFTTRDVPTAVVDVTEFTEMAAGLRFTCGSRAGGDMFCWGDNDVAQLDLGVTSDNSTRPVQNADPSVVVDVGAGESHACFINTGGALLCWGANDRGQLGIGSTSPFEARRQLVARSTLEVAAGRRHTCLLGSNEVVRCWGDNALGQLGNTGSDPSFQPTAVLGLGGSVSARRLAAGTDHSCAVRAEGAGACWGRSESGAIGNGAGTDALVPSTVSTAGLAEFQAFVSIAGGGNHNCALVDANGSSRFGRFPACSGDNRDRQADPTVNSDFIFTPRYISDFFFDFEQGMSAGSFHTCGSAD